MYVNYTIDHKLLELKELQDLQRSHRTAAWVALSAIIHFTKHADGMDLYVKQFAEDWNIKRGTLKSALDYLVEKNLIAVVRDYQRNGNIPRKYVAKRLVPRAQKVGPSSAKGWSSRDQVNNSKRIINQNSDDVNTSHSSSISTLNTYKPLSTEEIIKLKQGNK
jgi:hypothetical protein